MKITKLQNGATKKANGRKRGRKRGKRNGASASVNSTPRRNSSLSTTRVAAFAKKNGLKLVKRENGKKRKTRRRKRNGVAVVTRSRNGFFGNTKQDVKQVASTIAGAVGVTWLANYIQTYVAPLLARVGMSQYSDLLTRGGLAFVVAPMIAEKIGGKDVKTFVRMGGLISVALAVVEIVSPNSVSLFNPFNTNPIVIGSDGSAAVKTSDVKALVNEVANSSNPKATAAALSGALNAIQAGVGYESGYAGNMSSNAVLPLYD